MRTRLSRFVPLRLGVAEADDAFGEPSIVLVSGRMARGGCVGGGGSRCPALDAPYRLERGDPGPGFLSTGLLPHRHSMIVCVR